MRFPPLAVFLLFSIPAIAQGTIELEPPAYNLMIGYQRVEAGLVTIQYIPRAEVQARCPHEDWWPSDWMIYGCILWGSKGRDLILIDESLPADWRQTTLEHEIAHAGGWVHQ